MFNGHSSNELNTHYGLDTALVSAIESAASPTDVRRVLEKDLGLKPEVITDSDLEIVSWATRLVSIRAASLAACAIASVVNHTGNQGKEVDIGVDGSVAEFLPNFQGRVRDALKIVLGEEGEKKVQIGLAKDGSGVGGEFKSWRKKPASLMIVLSRTLRSASKESGSYGEAEGLRVLMAYGRMDQMNTIAYDTRPSARRRPWLLDVWLTGCKPYTVA